MYAITQLCIHVTEFSSSHSLVVVPGTAIYFSRHARSRPSTWNSNWLPAENVGRCGFKQMHPWKRAVHSLAPVRPAVPPRHTHTHQLKEDMTSAARSLACVLCGSVLASLAVHALTNRNNCAQQQQRSLGQIATEPICFSPGSRRSPLSAWLSLEIAPTAETAACTIDDSSSRPRRDSCVVRCASLRVEVCNRSDADALAGCIMLSGRRRGGFK